MLPIPVSASWLEEEWIKQFTFDRKNGLQDGAETVNESGVEHRPDNVRRFAHLDLDGFFNNRAFDNDQRTANLDQSGYYLLRDGLPAETLWQLPGRKATFPVPEIYGNGCDNISCMGQVIPINRGTYSSVFLLGLSEMGNYSDHLIIRYEDGTVEQLDFGFTNWVDRFPMYGNTVVWEGRYAHVHEQQSGAAKLYVLQCRLSFGKNVVGIELPVLPNIHIFAITLSA